MNTDRITHEQIAAMRSEDMAGAFPTPEAMRPDGTLIVGLPYSLNPLAEPQGYRTISPEGKIGPDMVYSHRYREFISTGDRS